MIFKSILATAVLTTLLGCASHSPVVKPNLNELGIWHQVVADPVINSFAKGANPSSVISMLVLKPAQNRVLPENSTHRLQERFSLERLGISDQRIIEEEIRSGCWQISQAPTISVISGETGAYEVNFSSAVLGAKNEEVDSRFKAEIKTDILADQSIYLSRVDVSRSRVSQSQGSVEQNQILGLDETYSAGLYKIHVPIVVGNNDDANAVIFDEMMLVFRFEAAASE